MKLGLHDISSKPGKDFNNLNKSDGNFKTPSLRFLFISALLSLIPFLIFFLVVVPCSDDIFYHNYAQDKTTWEFMVHHYSTWTGRYFSNLMMAVNPFTLSSDPNVYPTMMLTLFLIFAFSVHYFFKNLYPFFTTKDAPKPLAQRLEILAEPKIISWPKSLAGADHRKSLIPIPLFWSVLLIALFLHKMPRVTDTFYWFAGASSHLLPMSMVLMSLAIMMSHWRDEKAMQEKYLNSIRSNNANENKSDQPTNETIKTYFSLKPIFQSLLIGLFSLAIAGSNETLSLQWIYILIFLIFYFKLILNKWNWFLLFPLLVAISGFLVMYLAPGNSIRAAELKGGHSIPLLIVKPWGLLLETFVRYLSLNLILVWFWLTPYFSLWHEKLSPTIKSKHSRWLISLFVLGLLLLTFVPSVWTMGGLPPRRVLNNSYLFFLLGSLALFTLWIPELRFWHRWHQWLNQKLSMKFQMGIFAFSFLLLFNNFFAWKDLYYLTDFKNSLRPRDQLVMRSAAQDLKLPPLSYFPTTYFYEDITTKVDDYRNLVFAQFYKLKSVVLTENYKE